MTTRLTSLGRYVMWAARKHKGGAHDDLVQVGWVSLMTRRNRRGVIETQKRYLNARRDG